mgnify:CR=1 FL=1
MKKLHYLGIVLILASCGLDNKNLNLKLNSKKEVKEYIVGKWYQEDEDAYKERKKFRRTEFFENGKMESVAIYEGETWEDDDAFRFSENIWELDKGEYTNTNEEYWILRIKNFNTISNEYRVVKGWILQKNGDLRSYGVRGRTIYGTNIYEYLEKDNDPSN